MLPRAARLTRSRDFQAVYRTRRSWATPALVLHVRREPAMSPPAGPPAQPVDERTGRFGFVISKKVAKRAHVRNQLKRRMREISRLHLLPCLRQGTKNDLLFVARIPATALSFADLTAEMTSLMNQANLLSEQPAAHVAPGEAG